MSICDSLLADNNWGLPLAIATNLHIPYRIEIGGKIRDLHEQDNPGRGTYNQQKPNVNTTGQFDRS